jgi:membrane protein
MAYYAVQSFFPGLLLVVLVSLLLSSPQTVTDGVRWTVEQGLDPKLADALRNTLQGAAERASRGVTLAAVVAGLASISSASGWLAAAGRAIEPDADRRRGRNPILGRIHFSLWTLVLIAVLVFALAGLAAGDEIADAVFRLLGAEAGAPVVWELVRPVLVFLGIVTAMVVLFRIAPDRIHTPSIRHLLPGALVAGIGWIVASGAFVFYIRNLASLGATYGTFATPIILLLWLWLSGVVVLLGAAVNAELDLRRNGPHALVRLPGADDETIAGHPLGRMPEGDPARDEALLHPPSPEPLLARVELHEEPRKVAGVDLRKIQDRIEDAGADLRKIGDKIEDVLGGDRRDRS